jgi:hypothetical protein
MRIMAVVLAQKAMKSLSIGIGIYVAQTFKFGMHHEVPA